MLEKDILVCNECNTPIWGMSRQSFNYSFNDKLVLTEEDLIFMQKNTQVSEMYCPYCSVNVENDEIHCEKRKIEVSKEIVRGESLKKDEYQRTKCCDKEVLVTINDCSTWMDSNYKILPETIESGDQWEYTCSMCGLELT